MRDYRSDRVWVNRTWWVSQGGKLESRYGQAAQGGGAHGGANHMASYTASHIASQGAGKGPQGLPGFSGVASRDAGSRAAAKAGLLERAKAWMAAWVGSDRKKVVRKKGVRKKVDREKVVLII